MEQRLKKLHKNMKNHLEKGIIPFWKKRCVDKKYGGYLTNFDANGNDMGTPEKYLNTQARFIWGFSRFHRLYPDRRDLKNLAETGVDFLLKHFWDSKSEGWYWKTHQDGSLLDDGKVVYGQSFAIYALAEYTASTGDPRGLEYAQKTFDLLRKYCADTRFGGYYENLEPDWTPSANGFHAGDRKGLDTHMHLMEAFTTLAEVSHTEIHRQKLKEIIDLIITYMIEPDSGCGRNQFDLSFKPIPAIAIRRTWNAEREGNAPETPTDTTSYGHNVELAWLMHRALNTANLDLNPYKRTIRKLLDHAAEHGVDWKYGGVFRDGTHSGGPLILEKEFWQHCECLVGFLEGFDLFGEEKHLDAAENIWKFVDEYMINHEVGEWRTLLDQKGGIIDPNIGNPWKVCYHSGRSMVECIGILEKILKKRNADE